MTGKPPRSAWDAPPVRRRSLEPWRWVGLGVGIVLLAAAIGGGLAVREISAFADAHEGRILPGATIAGVGVGGMDREAALTAVRAVVDAELDRDIEVRWAEATWHTSPRMLGSTSDAEAVVDAALAAGRDRPWTELAAMRFGERRLDFHENLVVIHDDAEVGAYVRSLAEAIDRDPADASLDVVGGWVAISPHEHGVATNVDSSHERFMEALEAGEGDVQLDVATSQPEVTADAFDRVILLRQSDHRVYLYEHGHITREWPVAVGGAGYATPTGMYHVTAKRHMPTWINPAPNGWGASMPARIGPGASNPLGVRAINWNIGAIRFHGTNDLRSIGTNASKGCVRFTNADVVEFYDLIEVGTPIVSIG